MNDQPSEPNEVINIRSDAYIKGNVTTDGGDFVGRNKTTNIFNYLFGGTPEINQHLRARKILLENVYKFWVEGVLKHSLHNEVLLTLGLEEHPGAVDNRPWDMVLQTPQQSDRPLPPGTKIIDVFDQQQQSLLILGTPGSGKTTMLLELASGLIKRAQDDVTLPIPVVLNLSSWAVKRQPLTDWVAIELNNKYYIAPKVAQTWVENDALLLLLDGLDEVQLTYRSACVAAINAFRRSHFVALAICSRVADYEVLEQHLQLQGAVLIQPLVQRQIDNYFVQLGVEYTSVRSTLRHDSILQELAESPLMLSIMTLAYRGITVEKLEPQRSIIDYRQHLFDTYIQRMFGRREPIQVYSPQQTLHWLTWFATNMVQRQQIIFLIERLQPDWMQIQSRIRLYKLSAGLVIGLLSSPIIGVLGGVLSGLLAGSGDIVPTERIVISAKVERHKLTNGLIFGAIFGLAGAVVGGLSKGLGNMLLIGLVGALLGGFSFRLTGGVAVGLAGGLFGGLLGWGWNGLFGGVLGGLVGGVLGGLVGGVLGGLVREEDATERIQPNQGIRHSIQNMLIAALVGGGLGGLAFDLIGRWVGEIRGGLITRAILGFSMGISNGLSGRLIWGVSVGLIFGMLRYGGYAFIQHTVLRTVLWLHNYAPLNYARFLDYCTDRIFLRKVGGGYIFVHRLLMEHFAALTEEDIKRLCSSDFAETIVLKK